jgi:hypothetical protein
MYALITTLIIATIINLAVSTNQLRVYEVYIYIIELIMIGVTMTLVSAYLI